jgi:CBS domain-containing protein
MQVREIMTKEVEYVTNETSLQDAAEIMRRLDVGELPVVIGNEVAGIVTDRDITVRGVAEGFDPKTAEVVDIMTAGVIACRADDEIETVAKGMGSHKIRRMPVRDDHNKMCGMVSLEDLSPIIDKALLGEVLTEITRQARR